MLFTIPSLHTLSFLFLYLISLLFSITSTDFFSFWLLMEFSSLLFLSFILFSNTSFSYSSIIVFYLIQSSSSLGLLFSFLTLDTLLLSPYLALLFLSIKIGLFPFNFWYVYSVLNFPTLPLFFTLTFHKLFSTYIFSSFFPSSHLTQWAVGVIIIVTLLTSSTLVASSPSLLSVIIISSLFNNIWIVLSSLLDFSLFLLYFLIYSLLSFFLIFYPSSPYTTPLFFSLIGFPPLPLFFVKILILYYSLLSGMGVTLPFFLLLSNVALISLYFNFSSFSLKSLYSSSLYIK